MFPDLDYDDMKGVIVLEYDLTKMHFCQKVDGTPAGLSFLLGMVYNRHPEFKELIQGSIAAYELPGMVERIADLNRAIDLHSSK